MNITSKQWFQIISGVISSFITAGALFTTLFGQDLTLKIIAVLGLLNIMLNSIGAALSGQGNLLKDVAAITGDDGKPAVRVNVNANAGPAVAAVALDPDQKNVGASSPEVRNALIAKGA